MRCWSLRVVPCVLFDDVCCLLYCVRCLMIGGMCLLFVVCWLLFDVCCWLVAVRCLVFGVCCLLFAACWCVLIVVVCCGSCSACCFCWSRCV